MAKYTSGSSLGITRIQLLAVQLKADGKSLDWIAKTCFDCTDGAYGLDLDKLKKAKETLRKWYRSPKIQDAYKAIMKEYAKDYAAPAFQRLVEQLDRDDLPWLQNKAANDLLSMAKPMLFEDEDKTVVVKVEGAPDIGTPDEQPREKTDDT